MGTQTELDHDGFGDWLAGFLDGEGCFAISQHTQGRQGFRCVMNMSLRDDDTDVIRTIHERTGLGTVRHATHLDRQNPNARPQSVWTVSAKGDCLELVRILDAHPLRAKKARDYAIWREAVFLLQHSYRGQRNFDWAPLAKLATQLKEIRQYAPPEEPFLKVVA